MEMFNNAINWFEIPVTNFQRARTFYSVIYDYTMPEMTMGETKMGFLLFEQNGGVGGAIVHGLNQVPSKEGARIYLNGGADLNTVLQRVESAGGKIILPKTQITPEFGYYGTFEDTEGNHISLHSMG